jgi:hypothetical protein
LSVIFGVFQGFCKTSLTDFPIDGRVLGDNQSVLGLGEVLSRRLGKILRRAGGAVAP